MNTPAQNIFPLSSKDALAACSAHVLDLFAANIYRFGRYCFSFQLPGNDSLTATESFGSSEKDIRPSGKLIRSSENVFQSIEKLIQSSENVFPSSEKLIQSSENVFRNLINYLKRTLLNKYIKLKISDLYRRSLHPT